MLYLTFTMVASVDFAHYGVFRAKEWVSVVYMYCCYKFFMDALETIIA